MYYCTNIFVFFNKNCTIVLKYLYFLTKNVILAEGDSAHYAYNQPSGIPLKTVKTVTLLFYPIKGIVGVIQSNEVWTIYLLFYNSETGSFSIVVSLQNWLVNFYWRE